MFKQHELIPSQPMGRRMHLWRYGHWGEPILVFPSAAGFAHEWDAQGMFEAVEDLVDGGKFKFYCSESNVSEAFTRKENDPAWRVQRHLTFEKYVMEELVPFIRRDLESPTARISVAGCSLGAMYAAIFALKYPDVFSWALCMSGRYDAFHFMDGHRDLDTYLLSPLAFVPHLQGEDLVKVQENTHLTLVCGQGAWEEGCIEETTEFGEILDQKEIPNHTDIWGRDVSHGWDWWRRQVRFHLVRRMKQTVSASGN